MVELKKDIRILSEKIREGRQEEGKDTCNQDRERQDRMENG